MKIEEIHAPESMEGSEGLLALIIRTYISRDEVVHLDPGQQQATFVTDPGLPQQVAVILYGEGAEVPAHVHLPQTRTIRGTQEVILVRKGVLLLCVYTSDGKWVASKTLSRGEVAVLVSGGHSLAALTEAEIVEVKTGPYYGRERDKTPLKVSEVTL